MTDITIPLNLSYEQTISVLEAIENHYDALLRQADEAADDRAQWLHDTSMTEARDLLPLYAAIAAAIHGGPLGHRISAHLLEEAARLARREHTYTFEQKLHARITVTAGTQAEAEQKAAETLAGIGEIDRAPLGLKDFTVTRDESGLFLDEIDGEYADEEVPS